MYLREGGPFVGQLVPALHHEGVHPAGAVLWAGQQLPRPDHLDDLLVAVAVVGLKYEQLNVNYLQTTANKILPGRCIQALPTCLQIFLALLNIFRIHLNRIEKRKMRMKMFGLYFAKSSWFEM